MSARAGTKLTQFGYDQFGRGNTVFIPQAGAVQDDYLLGPGDEIVVSLRGQENAEYRITVDRSGRVSIPRINPITAAGRTLGDFRADVRNAVSRAYISTQAFVSLGSVRQIRVMVTGEVNNPGLRLVTGLSSPVDAILVSGGIKKTGSLRNVILVHEGTRTRIDLYDLLTQNGVASKLLLTDGDRIIVPPLGRTVAVVGWVKRPGIYELSNGTAGISVRSLLALAGGQEVRGRYRLSVLRVSPDGSSTMEALSGPVGLVRDSEILYALPGAQQTEDQAILSGGTALAGQYSVGKGTSLAEILKSPGALGPSPYTVFGVISRRDPQTLMRTLEAFTPIAVLHGNENVRLYSGDVVRVLSTDEARLMLAVVGAFRERRISAEEALRAPNLVTQKKTQEAWTQPAPQGSSVNSPQNTTSQLDQFGPPHTEREDIAELSTATLGDGGILELRPVLQDDMEQPNSLDQTGKTISAQRLPQNSVQNGFGRGTDEISGGGGQYGYMQGSENQQYNNQKQKQSALNLQEQDLSNGEVPTNEEAHTFGQLAKQLDIDPLVLVHFLMDHEVAINGAVHGPGSYLAGPNATLKDVVDAAGGTNGWMDKNGVELTTTSISNLTGVAQTQRKLLSYNDNLSSYIVKPHDQIHFNQAFTAVTEGAVTVQGQVRFPGKYNIERGEHLSELLLRAGGLTDEAYPYGTVFLRKSAAAVERQGYQRAADDMQNMIVAGLTRVGSEKTSPEAFTALQTFVTDLRNTKPLGRISIIADPALLAATPSRDPLLEPGDVVYIPQRPSTVTVLGQVMQPGTFQFSPKLNAKSYIDLAGGYGQYADDSLTFLILPDGTARPLRTSWLDFNDPDIPPGSTIVVPRDLSPIDTRQILLDVTSLLSSLAISAASLAVISNK